MSTTTKEQKWQKIAVSNINLLLSESDAKQKDLASYMGKVPQSLSKMLSNKQMWFFEDMCNAASFFNVGLDVLMRTDLTPLKAQNLVSEWGCRGLNPGPTDYESAALTD